MIQIVVSFVNFIANNDVVRYVYSIPYYFLRYIVLLMYASKYEYCESISSFPYTFWIENSHHCDNLIHNIINIHCYYNIVFVSIILCCYPYFQNFLLRIIVAHNEPINNKPNKKRADSPAPVNQTALNAKKTKLKNLFNEQFCNLLSRLMKTLNNMKLSTTAMNVIKPFEEEYIEIKNDYKEKLKLISESSIVSQN